MRTELEPQDVEAIAEKVLELLKPLLPGNGHRQEDIVFDVPGLSGYLKVEHKWIYEQTHLKTIPFFKLGNKQLRFRKSEIDAWTKKHWTPGVGEPTRKGRVSTTV